MMATKEFDALVNTNAGEREYRADVYGTGAVVTRGIEHKNRWHVNSMDHPTQTQFTAARLKTTKGHARREFPSRWMQPGDKLEVKENGVWRPAGKIICKLKPAHQSEL